MPRYFLTKVWGFSPEDYPVLGFTPSGGRNKFLRECSFDDWVVVVGTLGPQTPPGDRGRLLGRVRLGNNPVDVVAVLRSLRTAIPAEHWRDDGEYRWPMGLPILEAHRFVGKPDVASIFGDYLPGQEWAAYALALDERFSRDVVQRIADLATAPVDIARSPIIAAQVAVHDSLRANRTGPTGPGPSDHRDAVDRVSGRGFAYLLRLRMPVGVRWAKPVFKVGRGVDVEARVADLNRGLMPAVTGFSWEILLKQYFGTEIEAHRFEQAVHQRLMTRRVDGETEVYRINEGEVTTTWTGVFGSGTWALTTPE